MITAHGSNGNALFNQGNIIFTLTADTGLQPPYHVVVIKGTETVYDETVQGNVSGVTTVEVDNLAPGKYHYEITDVNDVIAKASFSIWIAPLVFLHGTVTPGAYPVSVSFEIGLTIDYGLTIPAVQGTIPAGQTAIPVSASLGSGVPEDPQHNLLPDTEYHYRMLMVNSMGSTPTPDSTFHTAPLAIPQGTLLPATGDIV